MRIKLKNLLVVAAVFALALALGACRSSTKDVKAPEAPPPPVQETEPAAPATVEQPTDFVQEEPASEALPDDAEALNKMAQDKGWIRDAYYEYDSSSLTDQAREALQASSTWLKSNAQYGLIVEGHCDERGTEQYNLALGERRAYAAKEYLVSLGIDAARIKTQSFGEERPFDTGTTEAAYAKNRRAHLVLTR
ncbi:MAG: peptidoglycan-associated lipoprotein Pal [Thermoanaerobaculia bacterium]|jgi:peptidoglycan-associated lipoprotein